MYPCICSHQQQLHSRIKRALLLGPPRLLIRCHPKPSRGQRQWLPVWQRRMRRQTSESLGHCRTSHRVPWTCREHTWWIQRKFRACRGY
jgi:hypothetical protein